MQGKQRRKGELWKESGPGLSPQLLAALALLVAALVAAEVLLAGRAPKRAQASNLQLQLSEIMSNNASALVDESGGVPDWVELRNVGSEVVELKGCSLVCGSEFNKLFSLPERRLAPGECALIYCEGMDEGATHGDWSAPFRLNASGGEVLTLLSPSEEVLDAVTLPELNENETYARDAQGEWVRRAYATPGKSDDSGDNVEVTGLQLYPDAVELSEVCPQNTLYFADESGEHHGYVELHNTSAADVNLLGWYLSDDAGKLRRWAFPAVTIPAGGYLAVHCSGLNRSGDARHLHTDFRIGDGEGAYLCNPEGHLVSMVTPPELEADQSWSLVDGAWSAELAPTPGAQNSVESAASVNEATFAGASVRISEIMASSGTDDPDWLELYNASAAEVDLSGCGLSDNSARPRKWQFPEGTRIAAGGYLGVALGAPRTRSALNADFALSAEGGYHVTLSDPAGRVVDAAFLPRQYSGYSYARAAGESGLFYFTSSTPGTANTGEHYRSRAAMAECSVQGGLYAAGQGFNVELSAPTGSRIYYTLDCTDPSEASTLYSSPIPITGSTILRTRVYRDGCLPSLIDTYSYLYDVDNAGGFYVVSLVTDPANLTGASGILTEANLRLDLEKDAHVELFTGEGATALCQGCGISLHGMDSRAMPIKSFNVIARSSYESNRFNYPIFSGRDYQSYQSFLLRPSGEDQNISFMRDTALSSLMEGSSLFYQKYEPALVYLNGEYYTLCYIRERINKYSVCQFEGWEGMEDEIDLVRGNGTEIVGSNASFEELLAWIKSNDMSTDAAYAYLDERIDIQNYIEYMAIQIFSGNTDTLNVRRYRNALADGKWRWVLFDLDWAFFEDVDSIGQWLTPGGVGPVRATDNTLFIGCMTNPQFRDRFLSYMGQQLSGSFSTENVVARFQAQRTRIDPAVAQLVEKWNFRTLNIGYKRLVAYAQERPGKLINYFQGALKLSDADMERYFGDAIRKIQSGGKEES